AAFVSQRVEDGEDVVEADRVRPAEDSTGVVHPVDKSRVDIRGAADALAERERGLVGDLADDPAQHQPGRIADPRDVLSERGEESLRSVSGRLRRVGATGQLD